MKFKSYEEVVDYAEKKFGLSDIGFSFLLVARYIKQHPECTHSSYANEIRTVPHENILKLYDLKVLTEVEKNGYWSLELTDKGSELYPKYEAREQQRMQFIRDNI